LIPQSTLQEDLKSLFVNEKFVDFYLIVQGKAIPCHKAILFSRCPYFQAFFTRWSRATTTTTPSSSSSTSRSNTISNTTNTNTNTTAVIPQGTSDVHTESTEIETHTLKELNYDAVKAVVEFIYSDFVQLTWDNAVDILGMCEFVFL
jgi:hypothetical protein